MVSARTASRARKPASVPWAGRRQEQAAATLRPLSFIPAARLLPMIARAGRVSSEGSAGIEGMAGNPSPARAQKSFSLMTCPCRAAAGNIFSNSVLFPTTSSFRSFLSRSRRPRQPRYRRHPHSKEKRSEFVLFLLKKRRGHIYFHKESCLLVM